jgi:hypothetical protein
MVAAAGIDEWPKARVGRQEARMGRQEARVVCNVLFGGQPTQDLIFVVKIWLAR